MFDVASRRARGRGRRPRVAVQTRDGDQVKEFGDSDYIVLGLGCPVMSGPALRFVPG
jgi:hypothetical protein